MKLARRSFLGLIAAAPFIGKASAAQLLEAMPPAPLDVLPSAAVSGTVLRTGDMAKLLWPGLHAAWGREYAAEIEIYR